jgi:hypothetical protein
MTFYINFSITYKKKKCSTYFFIFLSMTPIDWKQRYEDERNRASRLENYSDSGAQSSQLQDAERRILELEDQVRRKTSNNI